MQFHPLQFKILVNLYAAITIVYVISNNKMYLIDLIFAGVLHSHPIVSIDLLA